MTRSTHATPSPELYPLLFDFSEASGIALRGFIQVRVFIAGLGSSIKPRPMSSPSVSVLPTLLPLWSIPPIHTAFSPPFPSQLISRLLHKIPLVSSVKASTTSTLGIGCLAPRSCTPSHKYSGALRPCVASLEARMPDVAEFSSHVLLCSLLFSLLSLPLPICSCLPLIQLNCALRAFS